MASGVYGPNSQIGLICANVASTAMIANVNRMNALVLIRKTG